MVDIADLDPNVPTGQDLVSRGDDEIVRVKQAITTDFGGIDGPVYEDADENGLNGTTLMSAAVLSSFNARIQANADAIAAFNPYIVGQIILWAGAIVDIPEGWALCDGTNGTPDLRDRFVQGAGGAQAPDDTGGNASVSSGSAGAHNHGGAAGNTALTEAQMPAHEHAMFVDQERTISGTSFAGVGEGQNAIYSMDNSNGPYAYRIAPQTLSLEPTRGDTETVGQGSAHNHSIGSDGAHTHSVATVPPFYALAYIMYVGA